MNSKLISLFGIDGSGKSTITKVLINHKMIKDKGHFIICPRYHEGPSHPWIRESIILERLNRLSDERSDSRLKVVVVFFQLTLFRHLMDFWKNNISHKEFIFTERHPLVDSLVYGPFLTSRVKENFSSIDERDIWEFIEREFPDDSALFKDYFSKEIQLLPEKITLSTLPLWLRNLYQGEGRSLIQNLTPYFGADWPTHTLYLDIEVSLAMEFLSLRKDRGREMHENMKHLEELKKGYKRTFDLLQKSYPSTQFISITVSRDKDINSLTHEIIEKVIL